MYRLLLVLGVLFCGLFTTACATTGATTAPSYPAISEEEMSSFSGVERAVIPITNDYRMESYPDAVVFVKFTHTSNPKTEEVSGQGELPPLHVSFKRSDKLVGQRIVVTTESSVVCVAGTEDCSRSTTESVTVLRKGPLEPHTGKVKIGSVVHDRMWPGATRHAAMLDVTDRELLAFIGHVLDIRDGLKNPGECNELDMNRFISGPEQEPWRSNILGALSWRGYLTYHSLQAWMETIVRYRFVLNGCYAGAPNNQEAEALQRGEVVLSHISNPNLYPFNLDKF